MVAVHIKDLLPGAPVELFQCKYTEDTVTSTYGFVSVIVMNGLVVDILIGPAVIAQVSTGVEVAVGVKVAVGV